MDELDLRQLTLFPVDSRASHLAWLASKEELMMKDSYGRKCLESSEKLDQLGYSVKMYLESSKLRGGQYVKVFTISDTISPYLIMKLRLSEQRTDENECSLWATPNTMDNLPARTGEKMQDLLNRIGKNKPSNLREQVVPENMRFFITPSASEGKRSTFKMATHRTQKPNGNLTQQLAHKTNATGSLNPEWVEQLMGFPRGWTECAS